MQVPFSELIHQQKNRVQEGEFLYQGGHILAQRIRLPVLQRKLRTGLFVCETPPKSLFWAHTRVQGLEYTT